MRIFFALVLSIALAGSAAAQMFSYESGRPDARRTLTAGYYALNFTYQGDGQPFPRLDFDRPVYGIRFAQPGFEVQLMYGPQSAEDGPSDIDVQLLDVGLLIYGGLPLTRQERFRLSLPIALNSAYRVVGDDFNAGLTNEVFNFTTFGLGAGLALESKLTNRVTLDAKALPIGGLLLRSFEGTAGTTGLIDASVQLSFLDLFGTRGLSVGYGYRGQNWNVNASDLSVGLEDDTFDYSSVHHAFFVGLNF
ncbi:MAG: hypothetical protein AAF752_12885 [Bacteroidota bacterium]